MARSDGPEMAVVEGCDFRDVETFGHGDDRRVGSTEREVGVGLYELGHPRVVVVDEVDDAEGVLDNRAQERSFDTCATSTAEQITHFSDDRRRDEDLPPCEVQTGEEVGTGSVVVVVAVGGRDQRTGIADDHSGAPETLGEQVVVVAAEIVPATGEGREPRRWPNGRRLLLVLTPCLGEDGRDPLVGQVLDETPQFVTLDAHDVEGNQGGAGVHHGALALRSTKWSTNCCGPPPPVSRFVPLTPAMYLVAGHDDASVGTTDQKVRGSNPFGRA